MTPPPEIRALEFFSGIGAMHYGLQWAGVKGDVVASFDINPVANACYRHNFGIEPIQTLIETMTEKRLEGFGANAWFMSPPCQPYTRTGKQLDTTDPRAVGLLHLIRLLGTLTTPPTYLFLENVLNFESSQTRSLLTQQLSNRGYDFTEWFLTPTQMGLPNDRGRYYLTARRVREAGEDVGVPELRLVKEWPFGGAGVKRKTVGEFLEEDGEGELVRRYRLPEAFVKRRQAFSESAVVTADDVRTSCFTKAYGHHGLAAGSYLQTKGFDVNEPSTAIDRLGLRCFTPTEVARLHGFPIDDRAPAPPRPAAAVAERLAYKFEFPEEVTTIQRWRVLGNSMSVVVVGELMRCALFADHVV
ncbi:S-adenosyl-L-methionine-dependent methyltransferase [Fimicolochytrium jonesii]|uniref:S-adenosyl-L-methionine-dependent methyltransferase n=1 Tax=Fimicolochytrium jonesii TaxID=1396493 RepID=UPI0022FE3201|nr:S-adenosyl-L-methionine-dependent methyltransferase [Fimicolochytrium jonesii]KAI8820803.1 S-adenosyl-L-methionine-dependent methyltransferase [Fimicolochytrium jonesii]